MADAQERIGQQIGEYLLQRQLGRGTFGVVYLAEHVHDNTQVAIKLLRLQLTRSLELKDFLNEARVIRLRHPHIVPILDFGISPEDMPFLVMEYASGGTIRDRFWHGSSLPLPDIVTYTTQLAAALQFAHSRRLVHRDVKPENMLLHADGTVLLSDFGIAKIMEQSSTMSMQAQSGAGTPAYMAPEQGEGNPCPASDQYALAVVVYEWLTGRRPFQGTPLEIVVQHRLNPPLPLRTFRPGIPPEAERVILRALAKNPAERFETITHFAQALEVAFDSAETEVVPAIPRQAFTTRALGRQTEQLPGHPSASLAPVSSTNLDQIPTEREAHASDLLAGEDEATASDKTQRQVVEAPDLTESDRTQLIGDPVAVKPPDLTESDRIQRIGDPVAVKPQKLRRLFIPKRWRIFPMLLAMVILVACILGYLTMLRPRLSSGVSGINTQLESNAYNTAVANTGVMAGFSAQHSGTNPYEHILGAQTIARLKLKWRSPTGSPLASSPVIANNRIYVGMESGYLLSFATVTGQQIWDVSIGAPILHSSPAIANGLVYIGAGDGRLLAFVATNGRLEWSASTGGTIYSSPTFAHGLVYIGSNNAGSGRLSAFNAITGYPVWSVAVGRAIGASPAVSNGLVYIGSSASSEGQLSAFDAITGEQVWEAPTESSANSSPAIANGLVYLSSQDTINSQNNRLYAFDALTGKPRWVTPAKRFIFSSPAVADGRVYVGSQNGPLYAFNAFSGQQIWATAGGSSSFSSPAVANDLVYTSAQSGQVSAFLATTGKQVWTTPAGSASGSSPAIANGVVYVCTQDGMLSAFALV